MQNKPRDSKLIDALEALPAVQFSGVVWRVVREGHDPCACNASGGRWDDGTFEVLYTAQHPDGAIAELYFHLKRGLPVFPSRVQYRLYELTCRLDRALDVSNRDSLAALGIDTARFGQLSYQERAGEYPRTQEISEVAHFLDFDGLLVPNARWNCANVIAFCDHAGPGSIAAPEDHGLIDWSAWQREHAGQVQF